MKRIAKLRLKIEESNELFQAMSKDQKKVQIAKDCIERIKIKQFVPNRGAIISSTSLDKINQEYKSHTSLKDVLNDNDMITCDVCAKGGLFMSYVGRTNELKLHELSYNNINSYCTNNPRTIEHTKLLEIFDIRELAYIECAFECSQYVEQDLDGNAIVFSSEELDKAFAFYYEYDEENDRLIAICKNIIKNKGTFKL